MKKMSLTVYDIYLAIEDHFLMIQSYKSCKSPQNVFCLNVSFIFSPLLV